jgi:hypothetical protein
MSINLDVVFLRMHSYQKNCRKEFREAKRRIAKQPRLKRRAR